MGGRMAMKLTYEYATMPLTDIIQLTDAREPPKDSYLSHDAVSAAYSKLIVAGFRWIRTDGDWAVFERQNVKFPAMEKR